MGNLYLVGFMGSGKTAVGRSVARRLDREFVDLDDLVERRFGISIREVFETRGEADFRGAETLELEAASDRTGLVIATGGGTFSSAENRRMICESGGVSVFLDPPWRVILQRLQGAVSGRPMWIDEDHARQLFDARRPDYQTATMRIEVGGDEDPDDVAETIVGALSETVCAS